VTAARLTWLSSVPVSAVPVSPDRGQARDWANQELAKHEYQDAKPGLIERGLDWAGGKLHLLNFGAGAPSAVGLLVVVLLVAAVVGFLIYRAGGIHRIARRPATQVLPARHTTAAEHRDAADRLAAAGQWNLAVVERFRAIARELEERALLSPQPGRTALEVAREGGAALPGLATGLLTAARYFDDVSYGHFSVGADADQALRDLDDQLRAAQPVAVR
jgi:hypothetical protein